jgi:flagellar FliL protein
MKPLTITAVTLALLLIVGGAVWYVVDLTTAPMQLRASTDESLMRASGRTATYLPLEPAFLVNFEVDGAFRFLQVSLDVMANDPAAIEAVQRHMPRVRNNVLLTLSNQTLSSISSLQAKQALRSVLREEIRQVVAEVESGPGIDAVYFTSFVMQ